MSDDAFRDVHPQELRAASRILRRMSAEQLALVVAKVGQRCAMAAVEAMEASLPELLQGRRDDPEFEAAAVAFGQAAAAVLVKRFRELEPPNPTPNS